MGKTRARTTAAGITLDTGALIALDRVDKRMLPLLHRLPVAGESSGEQRWQPITC